MSNSSSNEAVGKQTPPARATSKVSIAHDPHRRTLLALAALCVLFLVSATLALWQRADELAPKYSATPLFTDLNPNAVTAIRVRTRAATFTVRRAGAHDWRVAEKGNFPADENQVLATVRGIASLETIEPKTANPAWLSQLGLVAPDKNGDATEVTLLDAAGKPLASLLVGKGADVVDAQGRGAIYVRKAGDNQAWLARGYLVAKPNLGDWLNKAVVTVGAERIQSVDVAPPTGSAYLASRPKKDVPDFTVAPLPAGRELAFESAADAPASAIVGFAFDDAQPAANFDFTHPVATHTTKTFDGLTVTVRVVNKDNAHWATVSAAASLPAVQPEANTINARANGWAFKLPDAKFNLFAATLDTLLKPLSPPPAAPGAAPAPAPTAPPTRSP